MVVSFMLILLHFSFQCLSESSCLTDLESEAIVQRTEEKPIMLSGTIAGKLHGSSTLGEATQLEFQHDR